MLITDKAGKEASEKLSHIFLDYPDRKPSIIDHIQL